LSGKRISTVFLDAGETLVHPIPSFPELFREVCASHGLTVDMMEVSRATRSLMAEVEERQKEGFTFSDHPEKSRRFWLDFYSRLVGELGYRGGDGLPWELYRVFSDPERYAPTRMPGKPSPGCGSGAFAWA
jgi:FMN phosphatase YigB (HAD superfamily)